MTDPSFRERILAAAFECLGRVPEVELVERNRQDDVDEDISACLLFFDGDMLGETDRPDAALRNPVFIMTYIVEIWGAIKGGPGNAGTIINDLFARTVRTLWADPQFRQFRAENSIGMRLVEGSFPTPRNSGAAKVAAFSLNVEFVFEFNPLDP